MRQLMSFEIPLAFLKLGYQMVLMWIFLVPLSLSAQPSYPCHKETVSCESGQTIMGRGSLRDVAIADAYHELGQLCIEICGKQSVDENGGLCKLKYQSQDLETLNTHYNFQQSAHNCNNKDCNLTETAGIITIEIKCKSYSCDCVPAYNGGKTDPLHEQLPVSNVFPVF